MRLLAIAESDAYVKWAAWTLQAAPASWEGELCLVESMVSPTDRQLHSAVAGTRLAAMSVRRHGLWSLRRRIVADRPDALLLALTGPTLAAVTTMLSTISPVWRPRTIAGLPGVGLPVRQRAVRARRDLDVFIAHSRRERKEYAGGFRLTGSSTRVALATLPFLADSSLAAGRPAAAARQTEPRPVFAAQPSVPASRSERLRLLESLAHLAPPAAIVKLRQESGERATHHEADPYPRLWEDLVAGGRVAADAVTFATGSINEALPWASCLVTISSTAALEAIAARVPVLIADDFGIGASLLNEVFAGSGLMAPLTIAAVDAAGPPRPEWAADNYFHPLGENDWIDVVGGVVDGRRDVGGRRDAVRSTPVRIPLDHVQLRAASRAFARIGVAGLRRRVLR